jgi:hypothetical protein
MPSFFQWFGVMVRQICGAANWAIKLESFVNIVSLKTLTTSIATESHRLFGSSVSRIA